MLIHLFILALLFTIHQEGDFICQLSYKGKDAQGAQKVELAESLLFTYTDEDLKAHIKDQEVISGYVSMAILKGQEYVVFRMEMASTKIAKAYGELPVGSPIKIIFLDGKHLFLDVVNTEGRMIDETMSFIALTKMDKAQKKELSKCAIDKLGLLWEAGYEEYNIYDVDLLKNQIECLKKHS